MRQEPPAAHLDLLRVIRGDFKPAAYVKLHGVSEATVYTRINKLIGKAKPADPQWKQGIGFKRNGKRAIEVLKKKAGSKWVEPSVLRDAPAEPETRKTGRPNPKNPRERPTPTISDADLQAVVNKHVTASFIARKYAVSDTHVARCVAKFRVRYGADNVGNVHDTGTNTGTGTLEMGASNGSNGSSAHSSHTHEHGVDPVEVMVQRVLGND